MQKLFEKVGSVDLPTVKNLPFFIDYRDDDPPRLVTGMALIGKGPLTYLGAYCSLRKKYREFRTDRIREVSDAASGEVLGDGGYLVRNFRKDKLRAYRSDWGLTSSRASRLASILRILVFMARCDGHFHEAEADAIARFVEKFWFAKDWPGLPPTDEIVGFARQLEPTAEEFFTAIHSQRSSTSSTYMIMRAVRDVIEADRIINEDEFSWSEALREFLEECAAQDLAAAAAGGTTIEIRLVRAA